MKYSLLVFFMLSFFSCCNSVITKDCFCGTWQNKEEKTKLVLKCDGTFTAIDIPKDVDNCFFNYDTRTIQGKWNKSGANQIELVFGRSSNCFLEIVNTGIISLRMRTKSDTNIQIDLNLED